MFWFAGLVGMGIESKRVRRWLSASAAAAFSPADTSHVLEPPSYRGSFNPFPALVIGVTGAAMSAHAQTYLFQVNLKSRSLHFRVNLVSETGPDTPTMGMAPFGILGSKMSYLLFCLAQSSPFYPPLSAADRSSRKLFPRMRRSDVYIQH
jgi:hypothetical protein